MAEYSQKWHDGSSIRKRGTKTSNGIAAIQAQLNNLGREIKKVNEKVYAAQVGCEVCKGPHYTKDCPDKEDGKSCEEAYYTQFGVPYPQGQFKAAAPGYYQRNNKNPSYQERRQSLEDAALANLGASVSVMPYSTYLTLGLGDLVPTKLIVELADRTIKYPKGIAKNVLIRIDKFTFPVDFVFLHMPDDIKTPLILGRPFLSTARAKMTSHDPNYEDFLELNDLNVPLELRHDQVIYLGPTIEEGEVIDAPIKEIAKARDYDNGVNDYPSFCDHDRKIHINGRYNLSFYNSIMNDTIVYKGKNVVGAFMNVPIFVGTFYVVSDFAVMENMDAYRDIEMGDVILGKEFCNKIRVNAKWFDGMITIFNGNDEVTYQMERSHPRFKHLTNEQCNKIKPVMKVSVRNELGGISYPYQKLKRFYKGVLNLGSEYLKDNEFEERLTRGHVSMHEME
ncbi:putative reverse transcriptase domain-containing protein [Tanacetum coccineum]|uniref:Reverse transcriptase domain-containing protein n=1 Tax=Tanacetum coccineum TaxID=301880 RepID=A0ABQ5DXJ2_9ASTR